MDMPRRLGAEFFGTFWLTFAGCGSAVLAAGFPALGIGFLGVSLQISSGAALGEQTCDRDHDPRDERE
jgi:glycerol uptake facilitator-like aquaporin